MPKIADFLNINFSCTCYSSCFGRGFLYYGGAVLLMQATGSVVTSRRVTGPIFSVGYRSDMRKTLGTQAEGPEHVFVASFQKRPGRWSCFGTRRIDSMSIKTLFGWIFPYRLHQMLRHHNSIRFEKHICVPVVTHKAVAEVSKIGNL